MARATLAPVICRPASCSQKSVWRYSSSATVTCSEAMDPAYRRGIVLVCVSALGFGAMAIFAKLAYDEGANTATLLTLRFTFAGLVLWGIVAVRRPPRPTRRVVLGGIGLGFFGYSLQAGGYFAAL